MSDTGTVTPRTAAERMPPRLEHWPKTDAGIDLWTDYLQNEPSFARDIRAIEDESWNAALAAVEEGVGGLTGYIGDPVGHLVRDPIGMFIEAPSLLAAIASLRKPEPSEPGQPPAGEGER